MKTLKSLWLDDNLLEAFPLPLCSLSGLTNLRLTGNNIKEVPDEICLLENLETLVSIFILIFLWYIYYLPLSFNVPINFSFFILSNFHSLS